MNFFRKRLYRWKFKKWKEEELARRIEIEYMHFSRTIPLRDLHAPVSLSIQTVYHAIPYIRSIFLIQGNNGRAATSWRAVIYFRVSREKREKKITRPFPSSLRVRVWGRRSWEGKSRHVRRDLRDDISPRIVDKTFRNRSFGKLRR